MAPAGPIDPFGRKHHREEPEWAIFLGAAAAR